ncbi:MAG: hypothetical protein JF585_07435 [Burkholderiales bacterium]|nr:hypothetical protein [Burkholderiales bacterium]
MSATAAIEQRISGQIGQPASCTILSKSTPSTCESACGARADYGLRSRAAIPQIDGAMTKFFATRRERRAAAGRLRNAAAAGRIGGYPPSTRSVENFVGNWARAARKPPILALGAGLLKK